MGWDDTDDTGWRGTWERGPRPCCSTHLPPHEQLLMGLGAVGVSSISVGSHGGTLVLVFSVITSFGHIWVHSDSSHDPPYKQGLVGMGAGVGSAIVDR